MKNTMKKLLSLLLVAVMLLGGAMVPIQSADAATSYPSQRAITYNVGFAINGVIDVTYIIDNLSISYYSGDLCVYNASGQNLFDKFTVNYCINKVKLDVALGGLPSFISMTMDFELYADGLERKVLSIENIEIGSRNESYFKDASLDVYGDLVNFKVFPEGYVFEEDNYSFSNPTEWLLNEKYFMAVYGYEKGKVMHQKHKKGAQGGLCFGMAYTTASILNNSPNLTAINQNGNDCSTLSTVSTNAIIDINSDKLWVGKEITVLDFLKYAFVYQWSWISKSNRQNNVFHTFDQVRTTIKDIIDNNSFALLDIFYDGGGHTILAVGYEEKADDEFIIYIDDPNSNEMQSITTFNDGSWRYSSTIAAKTISNENAIINYHAYSNYLYSCLTTNLTVSTNDEYLVYTSNGAVNASECLDISDFTAAELNDNAEQKSDCLYWVKDDECVEIENIEQDAELIFASDSGIITAKVTEGSAVSMLTDNDYVNTVIQTNVGDVYCISVEIEVENGVGLIAEISGTASGDTITATQTESGLLVTGISDGTVTLSKDDEVIATQTFSNAVSDIEITYDKTGADESVELNYEQTEESTDPDFVILGDVDENGKIDSADARLALRAAVNLENLTQSQTKAADVDNSGNITSADARLILRAAVGLEDLK